MRVTTIANAQSERPVQLYKRPGLELISGQNGDQYSYTRDQDLN